MNVPYLTADLPGIGGILKQQPEDFLVEEIPAYAPCGEGEHLFLWIEKRGLTTDDLTQHLARTLGVAKRDIGVAGLKDRQAVTRQYVSVPATCEARLESVGTDFIRILNAQRHTNKLRTGHTAGNRFSILIRNVTALENADPILACLRTSGFPNYFGPQRFGRDNQTAEQGFELLAGQRHPRDLPRAKRHYLLRLSLSAAQSELFNHALARRMGDGLLHTVLAGEVMQKVESGGLFQVEDVAAEQERLDAGETVITGPMFGPKMKQPTGEPAAREMQLLQARGLSLDDFANFSKIAAGARRAFVVRPGQFAVETTEQGVRCRFTLPSGAYATVLLREVMKNDN